MTAKSEERIRCGLGWGIFLLLTAIYWCTMPPEVSYWDCPEYVASARLLEIGHPPGNPAWMLFHRVVTMLAPSTEYVALTVNMASGVFMALASTLIALILYPLLRLLTRRLPRNFSVGAAVVGASVGALCFGLCDSAWYSAVEAEVYAMSAFFTSLTVWIIVKTTPLYKKRLPLNRTLILIAYIMGLSIGVHELNLLVIPALAVIILFSRKPRATALQTLAAFLTGVAAVGIILCGMMISTVSLAGKLELFAVNTLHLPFNAGTLIYVLLLLLSAILAIFTCRGARRRIAIFISLIPLLYLSGIFIFADSYILGVVITIIVAALLAYLCSTFIKRRYLLTLVWMLTMTLTGYSVYGIVLLRGDIPSQANATFPGNPFSLHSYIARDQYGSNPLLYGKTSYSRKMLVEDSTPGCSIPVYNRIALIDRGKVIKPLMENARLNNKNHLITKEDSLLNVRVMQQKSGYLVAGHKVAAQYTPELNMWFPRIHGSRTSDLITYEEWIGMKPETMDSIYTTEAINSEGKPVGRVDASGKRSLRLSSRPTYLQNIEWFLSYQTYYMYLRYLLWNFGGRQNDVPSSGEPQHGNFITGIDALDNMMLGADNLYYASRRTPNKGRNVYYLIPLLLGIAGIIYLARSGRIARRANFVIFLLFIMTGVAIVVYLNQSPNEPRERDYSFLGSYMAFAAWIGCGSTALTILLRRLSLAARLHLRKPTSRIMQTVILILPLGVPAMMFGVNLDDHDRSGRRVAANVAVNLLESLDRDAIIFVDGDNRTFPLWYAQEVLGVRQDVRIVNLSYLSIPAYFNALRQPWRESAPLITVASGGDVAYDSFMLTALPDSVVGRSMDAVEALKILYKSPDATFPAGQLRIPLDGDSVIINVKEIIRANGFRTLPFRRLAAIDIIASNASDQKPRPVYWLRNTSSVNFGGFENYVVRDLMTERLAKKAPDAEILITKSERLLKPNGEAKNVYMDQTPLRQLADQHAALIETASIMMDNGDRKSAERMFVIADSIFGTPHPDVYIFDRHGARLLSDTVASLKSRLGR